ncbi:MAG: asparagine synthase [Polyangiaceae bacterium]|nr:asparagine synthase [Polyangiaceae bacterium]
MEAPEAATRLFDAVSASVARAVGDRQRVAVMAGGGVDSSALLAATLAQARGATPKEITALTWDFGGDGDDRPYMRDLENALGIVPIRVSPAGATPSFARSLVVEGVPYTLLCGAMELQTFALAKERGCEMVLTGIGGDEVLAGAVQAAVLGGAVSSRGLRRLGAIPGAVRRAVTLDVSTARSPLRRIGDFLVRPLLRPLASRRLRTRNFVRRMGSTTPWLGPLGNAALEAAARETTAETRVPADARSRYLHFADRTLFEEYMDLRALLEEESGLPRADVYLDDALVELVARIPPEHLVFGGRHRGLFREALRGHVPESIRLRKSKASFDDAIQAYAASPEARTLVRSLGTDAVSADLGIADRRLLAEAATRIASERDPAAYGLGLSYLWSTLAAEAFLREQRP